MSALDYPITDPFGDTNSPYSKSNPHKGNDYGALEGTPVVVAGTQIGLSGHTGSYLGQTYAPHLHVQAGLDIDAQQAVEPTPYTNKPGQVIQAEFRSEWGNFVNIKCGDMYVHYCHLQRIDVKVGQIIGGLMTEDGVRYGYLAVTGKQVNTGAWTDTDVKYWTGRDSTEFTKNLYGYSNNFIVAANQRITELEASQGTPEVTINGTEYVPSK